MNISKPAATVLLIFVVLILAHSAYSLFQGNFRQATFMLPLLVVFYVFGIARQRHDAEDDDEDSDFDDDEQP